MLSKLTRGNQVTIPKPVAERAGIKVGRDYVDVEYIYMGGGVTPPGEVCNRLIELL